MIALLHLFAALSLAPAMFGSPQVSGGHLTPALCGGGAVSMEIPRDGDPPADEACSKGCHSGFQRKRIDRAQ